MGLGPVNLPVGEMMGAPTVQWGTLTLGSIELLPKRLCHWSLECLVLEEIPVNSLGGPRAVLLNMLLNMDAYQSPCGRDRRGCVANQAGPGQHRRLLGSGDVGAVPCFPWPYLGVGLDLSWVVVVATRKVTCESYGWSSWELVVRRSGRGSPRPMAPGAIHRSWNSGPEPI